MKKKSTQVSNKYAAKPSSGDEMDRGLLQRGDGMLPIVGLGGSAGSIAALQEFFAAMPVDSGMAFVIIMHLSPTHESTLAEMFQRSTAMPVVLATDGATVKANWVYVIPPGKFLASANGHFRLTDAEEHRGRRVAVDYFFRSLAETHGAQSLAVVLSGAGGDGALGLKRVKELGGLTIAQNPDEAEHPDMPRSAIATGVVDWVLGVKEMPAKLLAYVKQRGELQLPDEDLTHPAQTMKRSPEEQEAALRDVLAFLHTRTGRDFSCYKRATILRRIARRMQVNGLADLPGYLVYLRTHAGEAGALLQDLLISVTNFFRDPDSFAALERIIPEMFKGKEPGDTVRVWVAGCATGEEAYSIAMLLSEHASTLVGPPQIQVFASDLDEEVIREAREGLYTDTIAADVSEERLRHFFILEQGGYRVRRALRELVLFSPHDLLKDSPFSRLDLVSCRNLLIYLNREAQTRAFDIFHFALRPGGRLFLGTSETVDEGSPLFAVLDKKQRLYVKRPGPQRLIAVPAGPGTLARALALQERTRERPVIPGGVTVESAQAGMEQAAPFDSGLQPGELHYRLIERFSPPSILVNSAHDILHLSESAGRFLQFTGGEPTRNLLHTVHPMLRVELRAALYAAAQTRTPATAFRVPVEMGDARSLVDLRVTPAGDLAPDFLLVVFDEHPADGTAAVAAPRNADADQAALHLERELVATKAHLRSTIEESEASTEELKASNEELQAMNEELRSATEELETSREELQSINEELTTVNDEMKSKVDELARSNSDLQNLMAATDIATVFLDRGLRIQRFTPSAQTLFNFISTDLGRPLSDLSRTLDYPEIVTDVEHALAHLQHAQREVRAGDRWYIARILPYRTADDYIAGVVLTFTDVTTIKQGEVASARLAAIVESSSDAIIGKDLRGIVTSWNIGAEKMFGYTAAEMIGQSVARLIPAEQQAEEVEILARIGAGETIKSFDTLRVRKDGTALTVSETISPIRNSAGKIIGGSKIARDISEVKHAEAALRQSEERLSCRAVRSSGIGFWYCDLPFNVLQWDEVVKSHFHLPPDADVTIETFYDRIHPDDREPARLAIQESIAGRTPYNVDYRTVNPNTGAVKWVRAIGRTFYAADGAPTRFDGVTLDVTAYKNAQAQLQDADRRKDEFLATLSHEMRTPLGAIIGWINILRQPGCTAEDLEEGLAAMDRNSKAQVKLIEDVLDVSRIVNGKLRLETKPCEMADIIRAGIDTVRATANERGITLQIKLDPAASKISCDEVRMQQVMWNLLSNAVKFTPQGGSVTVTLERDRSNIRIQVKDNGQGMGGDLLPYVFERFRQADSSSRRKYGGLGLGLSIVKHIVEAHGGTVRAESEGEGKGSTFIVLLPIRAVQLEEDSITPATPGRGTEVELRNTETSVPLSLVRLDGMRVLLVDDEADARRLLERVLQQAGAKVLLAASAQEALDILSKQKPEILISDLGMPEEDGLDLIRQVRERGLHPNDLPAVALTAFVSKEVEQAALSAGFQVHVPKPVDPHDLTAVIASLTQRTK